MLVDPEIRDASEEEFEDSLITSTEAEYRSIQLGPERNTQNAMKQSDDRSTASVFRSETAIYASQSEKVAAGRRNGDRAVASTGIAKHAAEERAIQQRTANWRDEVAERLDNYAKRRGRKHLAGEFSMQLDFDRPRRSGVATAAALDPVFEVQQEETVPVSATQAVAYETEPRRDYAPVKTEPEAMNALADIRHAESAVQPAADVPAKPNLRRQPRVIEFPRLFPLERAETALDELADAVDRPRILDVPEETEQIVLPLGDISLEMQAEDVATVPTREFELPIQVASMSQRIFAAIADCTLVSCGTALFAGIVLNLAKGMPHNKLTLAVGLAVPCVLWAMYHYLFLVHGAATPGMKVAQLRLSTFNGEPTNRHVRRARALSLMLSMASAGMGFGWALVDEDTLCWHDRISRTYLTSR